MSKQDVDLSIVLASSYQKCKARFRRQKNNKEPGAVQTSEVFVPTQATALPQTCLNAITEIQTILVTPPQQTYQPRNASDCRSERSEIAEHIGATIEDASPTTIPTTAKTECQSNEAPPVSGGKSGPEVDDGQASETKSDGSVSTTLTSDWDSDMNLDRSDWEPLHALPHSKVHKILSQHVGSSVESADDYEYREEFQGGYNYVRIYNVLTGPNAGAYVIKVPSVGTALRWQNQDAYMLRSEFGTIKYISERTKCPVPEVIAYADDLDNDLGAPYILMKACTGVRAVEVWHGADANGLWVTEEVDFPSAALVAKRERMLRSLAETMAELRSLEFDKIGALDFDNVNADGTPTVGSVWEWEIDPECTTDMFTEKALSEKPACDSSLELLMDGLEKAWPREGREGRLMVIHEILAIF